MDTMGTDPLLARPPTCGPKPACQWLCAMIEDLDPDMRGILKLLEVVHGVARGPKVSK
jgi:hypothetical protein